MLFYEMTETLLLASSFLLLIGADAGAAEIFTRITESGDTRITEAGDTRITE